MEETAAHRRTIRPTPDKPYRNVGVKEGGKRQEGKSNKTENTEKTINKTASATRTFSTHATNRGIYTTDVYSVMFGPEKPHRRQTTRI